MEGGHPPRMCAFPGRISELIAKNSPSCSCKITDEQLDSDHETCGTIGGYAPQSGKEFFIDIYKWPTNLIAANSRVVIFQDRIWTMWKRSIVILVLLATALAAKAQILNTSNAKNVDLSAAPASVGNSDNAEAHNDLGLALAEKGDLDAAVVEFRKALELKPNYADAHNNLGFTLAQKGDLDAAIVEYQKALKLKPDYALAHNNLGNALAGKGDALCLRDKRRDCHLLDAAIVEYRKTLALEPDYAKAHTNLGIALSEKGDLDAAVVEFRKALELEPDSALFHNTLGWVLSLKGDFDTAIVEFRNALELKPDYADAHTGLGTVLADKGDLDTAIVEFRKTLELKPDDARAENSLREALNRKGTQSQDVSSTSTHPAILGTLEQGKYSNSVVGFEIQLNPTCAFADVAEANASQFGFSIRCGTDDLVLLMSYTLGADEEANLACCASPSLKGTMEGFGFKKHGDWKSLKIGGTDVQFQELVLHGDSPNQLGFYYAFLVGRRYVSILAIGPEANRTELSNIATTLKIEPSLSQ